MQCASEKHGQCLNAQFLLRQQRTASFHLDRKFRLLPRHAGNTAFFFPASLPPCLLGTALPRRFPGQRSFPPDVFDLPPQGIRTPDHISNFGAFFCGNGEFREGLMFLNISRLQRLCTYYTNSARPHNRAKNAFCWAFIRAGDKRGRADSFAASKKADRTG